MLWMTLIGWKRLGFMVGRGRRERIRVRERYEKTVAVRKRGEAPRVWPCIHENSAIFG